MQVRNVVFDFGGVLVRWAPHEVVGRLFPEPDLQDRVMRAVFRHPDWLELDRGALLESEAIARFAARAGLEEADVVRLLERIRESLTPIAQSVELMRHLAERFVAEYERNAILLPHAAMALNAVLIEDGLNIRAEVDARALMPKGTNATPCSQAGSQ